MRKLLRGIVEFRRARRPDYAETFARLALEQKPDALFVACSDSRVVPNLFASTEPGDLFVVRNVGNLIPPCGTGGRSASDESEAAAVEFALRVLRVRDVIICGHSECGAMRSLCESNPPAEAPNLSSWLRHAQTALDRLTTPSPWLQDPRLAQLAPHDIVSQLNVLAQIEHLRTYPAVKEMEQAGTLAIHGWWFDIAGADVYAFDERRRCFVLLDERTVGL